MANVKRYDPTLGDKKPFFIKGIMLYILPLPLLLGLFIAILGGDIKGIITLGIAYALFLLGASIARKGFLIEREYNKSILIKAPKRKYKTIGALVIAIAVSVTSFLATANGLILSIVLGIISLFGFYLYYGFDPIKDKIGELNIGVTAEEVIEITTRARQSVSKLENIKHKIGDIELSDIINTVITESKEVISAIEKNPNDLSRARKFFNVYLYRTEQISQEYLKNQQNGNIDENLRENFKYLLESITDTIAEQKVRLNEDDITRLDIQIEALTKQLKIEGV